MDFLMLIAETGLIQISQPLRANERKRSQGCIFLCTCYSNQYAFVYLSLINISFRHNSRNSRDNLAMWFIWHCAEKKNLCKKKRHLNDWKFLTRNSWTLKKKRLATIIVSNRTKEKKYNKITHHVNDRRHTPVANQMKKNNVLS